MNSIKSCGCIIVKDDKVLLVGAKDNHNKFFWSFPKGNQENGESDIETALRETKEEVNLIVNILEKNPIIVSHPIRNNTATKFIHLYLATPQTDTLSLQEDEIESAEWVSFDEAEKRLKDYYKQAWLEARSRIEIMDKNIITKLENYIFEHKAKPGVAASIVAGIVGVMIGVKPATVFSFDANEFAELDPDDCKEAFSQAGLVALFFRHEYVERNKITWIEDVYVACDTETADKLHQAFIKLHSVIDDMGQIYNQKGWEEASRDIGRLLGYPETAIEYFIANQDPEDEERKRLMARYQFYIHSPEHHEEEYQAYDAKIFQAIRDFAPKTADIILFKKTKKQSVK